MQLSIIGKKEFTDEHEREAAWIKAAQADISAFEPLYVRYHDQIYRYLRTRLKSDDDAADLTHQVFLQAMYALPRYKQWGVPFAVWLFRIARNAAINAASSRLHTVPWEGLPEVLDLSEQTDPEARALHAQTLAYLKTWLQQLKQENRELLALRFAAGLSVPQIAAVVGKRPNTIKKQLSRLLRTFKEQHYEKL